MIVSALLILGVLCAVAGIISFVLGSLGIANYRLRRWLPTKSPISLMHLGSALFFIGFVCVLAAQFLHGRTS